MMITADIPIDEIEGQDFIKVSNEEPDVSEKRSEPRKQRLFRLNCKVYNPESDTFEISDALVHNFSVNGLYFEAAIPFQPRDPVCLFLKDQLLDKCDNEFTQGVHAQIIWCRPMNKGFDLRFGAGVKYFEPITYWDPYKGGKKNG